MCIKGFRKQLNGLKVTDGICIAYELFCDNAYTNHGFKITDEQSTKGIEFLTKLLFKKNGDRRNTKLAKETDDILFHCIKNFESFNKKNIT